MISESFAAYNRFINFWIHFRARFEVWSSKGTKLSCKQFHKWKQKKEQQELTTFTSFSITLSTCYTKNVLLQHQPATTNLQFIPHITHLAKFTPKLHILAKQTSINITIPTSSIT